MPIAGAPAVTCRGCGTPLTLTPAPNSTWCDDLGFTVCVKALPNPDFTPGSGERAFLPPVLHEPMPAGLEGGYEPCRS